jgi:hypothetical protein
LAALSLALLSPAAALQAAPDSQWDGVWKGSLEHVSQLTLTIANGKVVSYAIAGAPVAVQYSKSTPTTFSFGDHDHFSMILTRTSETTAAAKAHGRNGFGAGVFTRQ